MKTRRIVMSLLGVIICAVSVGVFKIAALGVDPFQSLMSGLNKLIPISFGTLYVIVNLLLLSFTLITDRHYIGIATFINLFLLGYITQFTYDFLKSVIVNPSLFVRILCLLTGIVVICIGSAFYITADLGVSTYDAVALVLCNKYQIGKFQFIRVGTDLICVISGALIFLLGGGRLGEISAFIGAGTIVTAFFMGPLIEFFSKTIVRPLLKEGLN